MNFIIANILSVNKMVNILHEIARISLKLEECDKEITEELTNVLNKSPEIRKSFIIPLFNMCQRLGIIDLISDDTESSSQSITPVNNTTPKQTKKNTFDEKREISEKTSEYQIIVDKNDKYYIPDGKNKFNEMKNIIKHLNIGKPNHTVDVKSVSKNKIIKFKFYLIDYMEYQNNNIRFVNELCEYTVKSGRTADMNKYIAYENNEFTKLFDIAINKFKEFKLTNNNSWSYFNNSKFGPICPIDNNSYFSKNMYDICNVLDESECSDN